MSARSRMALAMAAVAAVLATTPVVTANGGHWPAAHLAGSERPAATSPVAYRWEPAPTDSNSVIVDCVELGNRLITGGGNYEHASKSRLGGLPILAFGPSPCWPPEES